MIYAIALQTQVVTQRFLHNRRSKSPQPAWLEKAITTFSGSTRASHGQSSPATKSTASLLSVLPCLSRRSRDRCSHRAHRQHTGKLDNSKASWLVSHGFCCRRHQCCCRRQSQPRVTDRAKAPLLDWNPLRPSRLLQILILGNHDLEVEPSVPC